jgi:hypothetical protein
LIADGIVGKSPTSQLSRNIRSRFSFRGDAKKIKKQSTIQDLEHISDAQEMVVKGVDAVCKGFANGDLRGFHVNHYPAGHTPTDFEKWRRIRTGEIPCCEVCRSFSIRYEEGFEPFIICARKLIPSFDERFRGYGYDKVAFFYHLHLIGFKFRALLHSCALDIPHHRSQDWLRTFGPGADSFQVEHSEPPANSHLEVLL